MYDTNRREENIYGPFQRIWSELSFETIYSDIYRYIFLIKSVYRCCVTLKIKRGKIWNKNLEKFDQLLPKTLVPKKHRRKIYRGKARFKKWLVTRQSGPRYHFPRWPYTITVYCRPLSRDTMFQPSIYDKGGGKKKATKWNFIAQVGPLLSSNAQFLHRSYENVISPKRVGGGKNFCRLAWTVTTVTHTPRPLLGLERQ